MFKQSVLATTLMFLSAAVLANNSTVEMKTNLGDIEIELFNDKAPVSAKNFEEYVKSNFYEGTIFHRVIPNFMVQGGGFNANMQEKENKGTTIQNESSNGLSNKRGTLAMARTNDPNSARSQFFINLVDNAFLDRSERNAGYAVFGQVTKGMDVVDKMLNIPRQSHGSHQNVPQQPILIQSVNIKAAAPQNSEK